MPRDQPGHPDEQATLEARNRQIAAVHTISRLLSSSLDLEDRLRDILTVSLQAVGAVAGTIFLHRPEDDTLVFRYVVGEKAKELTGLVIHSTDGLAGAVFQSGESQISNRPRESAAHYTKVEEETGFLAENMVTVPLKHQTGRPIGVMQILNKQSGEFNQGDLEVLEIIASVAAASIQAAQLARDAQTAAIAHAVGDLSHDIKNKMTPISLTADTLQMMMDDLCARLDELMPHLPAHLQDGLRACADPLRDLYPESFRIVREQVQEVQDYTKLIADALQGVITEPQLELHQLHSVIERQLDLLDPVARRQGVELIRQFGAVPRFRFDRFQIERAVHNLVNNAIPETPAGGRITVRTEASAEGRFPQGSFVLIEVSDTGRGMPPHVLERILRGDPKSTKVGGTGLGTRIVFNAVMAHKGRFEGGSKEGVGTTFRLRLPLLTE